MFTGRGVRWEMVVLGCAVVACSDGPSRRTGAVDHGGDAATGGVSPSSGGAASTAGTSGAIGASAAGSAAAMGAAGAGGASAGGTAAAMGRGGTAGGTGGAAPMTEHGACVAYFVAQCNRNSVCDGFPSVDHPCPDAEARCPDILFSPGSLRTVDNVLACTEVWKTFSCDELHLGYFPACAMHGTRRPGETCVYDSQCDSLRCVQDSTSAGRSACGTCTTVAAAGAACSYSLGPLCADGDECDLDKGLCVKRLPFGLAPGSACERLGQCGQRAYCLSRDPTNPSLGGTCQLQTPLGEACVPGSICAAGGYCSNATRTCEPLPKAGSPCGLLAGATIASACARDAFCNDAASSATCMARLEAGASCKGQPGLNLWQGDCADGLSCVCSDATCPGAKCLVNLREGEACGSPNSQCVPGTACQNGICVGVSQSIFASACRQ